MGYTNNLNGKVLHVLIDFDFIVNTELGLIRFIRNNFRDPRAFKLDVLDKSDREILSLLYARENMNPLIIVSSEDNLEDIDGLYKSFFENYKKEIISLSSSEKSIMKFVNMSLQSSTNYGIDVSFAVNDDIEKKEIQSHFKLSKSFVYKNDKAGILNKDPYYIKDYTFFLLNDIEVSGKKIYMSPRLYNKNYFTRVESPLTRNNDFVLMGKDYSEVEEDKTKGEKTDE